MVFSRFNIIIIINLAMFFHFKLCSSLSANHFDDCTPEKCGNVTVSYPFSRIDQQKTYCGYPGFEISCKNEKFPSINISGVSYVIKNVSYEEQTLQVINSIIFDKFIDEIHCVTNLQHLNTATVTDSFEYTAKHSEIFLLSNCTPKILQENTPNTVICGAVGMYQNASKLDELKSECIRMVSVPYDGEGSNVGNVKKMLEEGFSLKWVTASCSDCVNSGGKCGYNQDLNEFNCFCADRTHANSCPRIPVKKHNVHPSIIMALGALTMGAATLMSLVICVKRGITFTGKITIPWTTRADGIKNVEAFLNIYGSLAPKRFSHHCICYHM